MKAVSLVDYSDSDDGDRDTTNDKSTRLQYNDAPKKSKKTACVPKPSKSKDPVGQSSSEDVYVPKLRRTKSILMNKMNEVPSFSDALFDSSDDSVESPLTSSEMCTQRLRRGSCFSSFEGLDEGSENSEEEYIPETNEESTDSEASLDSLELSLEQSQKNRTLSTQNRSTFRSQGESSQTRNFEKLDSRTTTSKDERAPLEEEEEVEEEEEEEESIHIAPVLKKEDGSRKYNKKHHCVYCGVLVQKMSRHLLRKHMDKVEVAKASSLPKNSKQRRLQLDYIRNKGNFERNTEVLQSKEGKLIPWKQPKQKTKGKLFSHCLYCYGLFKKKSMWRHFKSCKFKPQEKQSKKGRTRFQTLCAFAEPVPPEFSEAYWKFLSEMNQDKITVAIKEDHCLLEYGYRLFNKNERVVSQHQYIRQKLRELGRLLLEAKNVAPVKSIKDLIKPEKYSLVVTAAKCLAGYSDESGKYQRPSLARKVGHSMHSLAMFIKTEGLKMKDKETVQDAEEFAQLYQESWRYDIASQALTQLEQKKWNAPLLLPFTHDVQILHDHLSEKQQQHLNALKEKPSHSNWKNLAKVTLAQVILFNRRRAGEVSRMPLSVYLSKDASETHEDVNLALTALEQKLCSYFVRISIVGKRGRKVPVLLSPPMKTSIDALCEKREECGVLKENEYLFALPYSAHYIRGSDCIRQFVSECDDIKNPAALTSTKLRKHIATLSTVLNLKTTELDQLADFLGHNIAVHRKHYRLPEGTLQLAKVSKVLLALEQGRLGEYKGKSLDEIHLDVNETLDIDGISQEDNVLPEEQGTDDECSTSSLREEEQMPEDIEETSCTPSSSGSSKEKLAKKKEGLIPGDIKVTSCTPTSSGQRKEQFAKKREGLIPGDIKVTSCTPTSSGQTKEQFAKKRGREAVGKRNWSPEECAAVNRHLKKYIVTCQVPGKVDCERCIAAEPEALSNRDWKGVKYFIKNRITTMRKKFE